jgi:hypothetical protein
MTTVLTYVEIDVPAWTQTSPDSPEIELTFRFAVDTIYLPNNIAAIPSINEISIQPAIVSLGENLGQRASVTVTFRDHRHVFDGEDFSSGTFWGKFRARYGLTLQGNPLRLIHGELGQELEDMETRHYLIDTTDGPTADGIYKIIAKDILTFARASSAQAPLLSNGFVASDILAGAGSLSLSPTGIGSEYPASGFAAIGGKEIVAFTRLGDVMTLTRAQFNTIAQAHNAQDRVQLCLEYSTETPSFIINDLFVTYAGIDQDFIPLSNWEAETAAYLGSVYTALIADPKPVDQLVSELIEQAALAVWWDDRNQQIRLQVLRSIGTTAATYDQDNTLQQTLEIEEQPQSRLSDIQVYFAKINPLIQDDETDNYRSVARVTDDLAEEEYGTAAIKVIHSRWIPVGGRIIAETLANKQLGRFRDPPRIVKFDVMRDQPLDPELGGGYQLGGTPFQTIIGAAETIPIQIIRLNPREDRFLIEAQEMLWTPFGGDIDPNTRTIIFDSNINNINLREIHDDLYPEPQSGNVINVIVNAGVIIGSTAIVSQLDGSFAAFDVGTWPGGVTINMTINGRIQGRGGEGRSGGSGLWTGIVAIANPGGDGLAGGTALFTRTAINVTSTNGEIWGGGGGGGGGGGYADSIQTYGGGGGGGGAGTIVGVGGTGGSASGGSLVNLVGNAGDNGVATAGGIAGQGGAGTNNQGGNGGGPGLAGAAGTPAGGGGAGGAGGTAGHAIDGDSFVTDIGAVGDIRGGQVN